MQEHLRFQTFNCNINLRRKNSRYICRRNLSVLNLHISTGHLNLTQSKNTPIGKESHHPSPNSQNPKLYLQPPLQNRMKKQKQNTKTPNTQKRRNTHRIKRRKMKPGNRSRRNPRNINRKGEREREIERQSKGRGTTKP